MKRSKQNSPLKMAPLLSSVLSGLSFCPHFIMFYQVTLIQPVPFNGFTLTIVQQWPVFFALHFIWLFCILFEKKKFSQRASLPFICKGTISSTFSKHCSQTQGGKVLVKANLNSVQLVPLTEAGAILVIEKVWYPEHYKGQRGSDFHKC